MLYSEQKIIFTVAPLLVLISLFVPELALAAEPTERFAVVQAVPDLSKVAFSLLAVLAVLFASVFLLKKFNLAQTLSGAHGMQIIASLPLNAKDRIVLLQVGETAVLMSHTPHQIECLHVYETIPELQNASASADFMQHVVKAIHKKGDAS